MDKRKVTVCSECFRASCWEGYFMCDLSANAKTIEVPIWILEKLKLESPDYWKEEVTNKKDFE